MPPARMDFAASPVASRRKESGVPSITASAGSSPAGRMVSAPDAAAIRTRSGVAAKRSSIERPASPSSIARARLEPAMRRFSISSSGRRSSGVMRA